MQSAIIDNLNDRIKYLKEEINLRDAEWDYWDDKDPTFSKMRQKECIQEKWNLYRRILKLKECLDIINDEIGFDKAR